jgi:F-type H+-transporting ATPase subunit a
MVAKNFRLLCHVIPVILPVILIVCGQIMANGEDAGKTLMEHVSDSHTWHPVPFMQAFELQDIHIGPVKIPFTRDVISLLVSALLVALINIAAFRKPRILPSMLGSAIEPIILFIRDGVVMPILGQELGARWLPFFLTLFFFILTANLVGLVPLFTAATGNLSVTAALAAMVFICVVGQGVQKNGIIGFFKAMVPAGVPWPIGLLLITIEIPGLFIRNSVLAIRLFANMVAGHFVIFSLLLLITIIHPLAGFVSIPLALFMDLLEILVAIIQAFVFTMLSTIFISMAAVHH